MHAKDFVLHKLNTGVFKRKAHYRTYIHHLNKQINMKVHYFSMREERDCTSNTRHYVAM